MRPLKRLVTHNPKRGTRERATRVGRVVLIDNTLWGGSVAEDTEHDPSTEAIRAFNNFVHEDQRVEMVLLPIGDGLTLTRKIA